MKKNNRKRIVGFGVIILLIAFLSIMTLESQNQSNAGYPAIVNKTQYITAVPNLTVQIKNVCYQCFIYNIKAFIGYPLSSNLSYNKYYMVEPNQTPYQYINFSLNKTEVLKLTPEQIPTLINNYGNGVENEYLYLTGYPIYKIGNFSQQKESFWMDGLASATEYIFGNPINNGTSIFFNNNLYNVDFISFPNKTSNYTYAVDGGKIKLINQTSVINLTNGEEYNGNDVKLLWTSNAANKTASNLLYAILIYNKTPENILVNGKNYYLTVGGYKVSFGFPPFDTRLISINQNKNGTGIEVSLNYYNVFCNHRYYNNFTYYPINSTLMAGNSTIVRNNSIYIGKDKFIFERGKLIIKEPFINNKYDYLVYNYNYSNGIKVGRTGITYIYSNGTVVNNVPSKFMTQDGTLIRSLPDPVSGGGIEIYLNQNQFYINMSISQNGISQYKTETTAISNLVGETFKLLNYSLG